ncbi:hypothetical protein DSL72_001761 [Monilinia vaccinii-corymbosi]|uniref:Uncharacterized protein n=1 Tax=Monilinia vaccinii-corymbosi TaxID=61207 RepID=A0A8A3PAR1_9HELO|nr:hypothetical protein DSL72_001761 [Monilinia vaccinii-corymbosi]
MSFKHTRSLSPILALEFYHTSTGTLLILAAEGPFLNVYDAETSTLISQCRVFESQASHGIIVREFDHDTDDHLQIVIWGGSCLTLISRSQVEKILSQNVVSVTETAAFASDWVLGAAFCPWEKNACVIVTAHNAMLQATLSKEDGSIRWRQLQPSSRSMLYSANLVCENEDTVIVAAGTIFGEIIVWKCIATENCSVFRNEALFIFTGHEGSIFGVDISPLIAGEDGKSIRLLASCSDDRTIRIWNLAEGSQNDKDAMKLAIDLLPRETGFGETPEAQHDSRGFNRCVAVTMGHASRIWGVKFHCPDILAFGTSPITVLSFGEDSTVQQWALELGSDLQREGKSNGILELDVSQHSSKNPSSKLTHIKTFAFHTGKHIWSAAITQIENNRSLLATGGADGKISTYCFDEERNNCSVFVNPSRNLVAKIPVVDNSIEGSFSSITFEIEEVLKSLTSTESHSEKEHEQISVASKKKATKDAFNRYAFVSEDNFLITTTFGRILRARVEDSVKFEELSLPESRSQDLKSYSILKGNSSLEVCFFAGANGNMFFYQPRLPIVEIGHVQRKPSDMFIVPRSDNRSVDLLVTLVGTQELTIFSLDLKTIGSQLLADKKALSLPLKFVVTGAGRCGDHLVIGSREGQIAVHDINFGTLVTWNSAGRKDAITSIVAVPNSESQQTTVYFAITSRDGLYSILSYDNTELEATSRISCVHQAAPPFGPMIESCWFQGSDLIMYGFKSKSLVVWNETKQSEIMRIDCGGAHRAHAYSPHNDNRGGGSGHLIYTKASQLYLVSQMAPSHRTIKPGGHGREIKAVAVGGSPQMIVTGAEDTNIRIWRYEENKNDSSNSKDLSCLAVIQKHTAGIQHLHWHNSNYLFSSGGVEEFYIWSIQEIPGFGLGVICEASCPDPTEDQDLRIMSFDVSELPESTSSEMIITLAYSDSTMRTYVYSKTQGFKLLAYGKYTSACLTQITHLQISHGHLQFLTASTDGSLCIWWTILNDPPAPTVFSPEAKLDAHYYDQYYSLLEHKKIHQNAIKALAFTTSRSSTSNPQYLVVVTGGDDNALAVTLYRIAHDVLTGNEEFAHGATMILPDAHAAAVTGLAFVPGSERKSQDAEADLGSNDLYVLSTSTDQRVKTWRISLSSIGAAARAKECPVEIELVGDEFTAVADIGDVAVIAGTDVPSEAGIRGRNGHGTQEYVDGDGDGDVKTKETKAIIVGAGIEIWGFEGERAESFSDGVVERERVRERGKGNGRG